MKLADLTLHVNEIPHAGLLREGELPASWAHDALLPAYEDAGPVATRLEIRRMGDNVFVEGDVAVTVTFLCSRTAARTERRLDVPIAELFIEDDGREIDVNADLSSDDLDSDEPCLIRGGVVDVAGLIHEQIVLAQDPFPLAPGVERDPEGDDDPVWTSDDAEGDPRWAKLKHLLSE